MVVSDSGPDGPAATGNAATRARLVDAAIEIATAQGLDKLTYRSVAAHAGLSHSLVRFYFGTREALVTAALERAAQLDAREGHLYATTVEAFGSRVVESISANNARGMLQYDYLLRALRQGESLDGVVALYEFYQSQVAGTLANIGIEDPNQEYAALVFAALDGLVLQHAVYGSDQRTERLLDRLRHVLRLLLADVGGTDE